MKGHMLGYFEKCNDPEKAKTMPALIKSKSRKSIKK